MRLPVICLLACAGLSAQPAGSRWESLFDGKSLAGWRVESKPADAGKNFWTAAAGVIQCDSLGRPDHDYVWLVSEREFDDFELRLEVRGFPESKGNSGVQVRSRYDREMGWLHGPQVDIHPPAPWRTGLIYDETWEARRWIYPSLKNWEIAREQGPKEFRWRADGWNGMRIICRGGRITTVVNGLTITDEDLSAVLGDEAHRKRNAGLKGHLALQLHARDELKIQFRNLRIRPLR